MSLLTRRGDHKFRKVIKKNEKEKPICLDVKELNDFSGQFHIRAVEVTSAATPRTTSIQMNLYFA